MAGVEVVYSTTSTYDQIQIINQTNHITVSFRNIFFFYKGLFMGWTAMFSCAWVVAATELISRLDTMSPVTVPTGMAEPPSAFSVGFYFPCCWHCLPRLWYEL